MLSSCSKSNTPEEAERLQQSNVQHPIELAAPVANVFTDFSFHFFNTLQSETNAGKDIFVSPLSLHIALGMLVNGAKGETKSQMIKALRSESLPQEELNNAYKTLLTELPKADPLVKMALANAIFYRNRFTVETPFLNTMKNTFDAQITGLPFIPSDKDIINKWASDHTNGKIPKVLDNFKPEDIMFLLNALYFKGNWRSKFDKKNTKDQPFYLEGGGQKTVKMMNQKDTFMLASGSDFTALQMPYGNGQFRATLILPNTGKSLASILNGMSANAWGQLQNSFHTRSVKVGLPKFKLEQEFKLNETLKSMGMLSAFLKNAELEGIGSLKPLFVDFVKQNTFVAVDEEGTEAAAVTTIGVVTASMPVEPPQFVCNRPFGLVISEETSNIILFMGRIMDPKE
ncbi:MAG TPA: serpin family protein [Niabella sp.]|nr:serpin family protein [Niabella sp.]